MVNTFVPLVDCNEALPAGLILDRIAYYWLVPLTITTRGGKSHQAVYTIDYAMPRLTQEAALNGWPPNDHIAVGRGVPLLSEWDSPSEQVRAQAAIRHRVEDLDQFLANPVIPVGSEQVQVPLEDASVRALLLGRPTLVRRIEIRIVRDQPQEA